MQARERGDGTLVVTYDGRSFPKFLFAIALLFAGIVGRQVRPSAASRQYCSATATASFGAGCADDTTAPLARTAIADVRLAVTRTAAHRLFIVRLHSSAVGAALAGTRMKERPRPR
jgi:hypothetical protein